MEIVLAFSFLIGAFALGSNASIPDGTEGTEHAEVRSERASREHVADIPQGLCRYADGPPLQRDLTVPRAAAARLTSNSIEEPGRACLDK
jgi:hypothetical protein